jgi:hypothetical protein
MRPKVALVYLAIFDHADLCFRCAAKRIYRLQVITTKSLRLRERQQSDAVFNSAVSFVQNCMAALSGRFRCSLSA